MARLPDPRDCDDRRRDPLTALAHIDYILKWVEPAPGEGHYAFWISPATLVFESVSGFRGEHEAFGALLEMDALSRTPAVSGDQQPIDGLWEWILDGHDFTFELRASGYRQHLRAAPRLVALQRLSSEERGGLSFEQPTTW